MNRPGDIEVDDYVFCIAHDRKWHAAIVDNVDRANEIAVVFPDGTRVEWPRSMIKFNSPHQGESARAAFNRESRAGESKYQNSMTRKARECVSEAKESLRARGLFGKVKA